MSYSCVFCKKSLHFFQFYSVNPQLTCYSYCKSQITNSHFHTLQHTGTLIAIAMASHYCYV